MLSFFDGVDWSNPKIGMHESTVSLRYTRGQRATERIKSSKARMVVPNRPGGGGKGE